MEKIDELKEPPIIGKTYLVPCILVPKEPLKGIEDWTEEYGVMVPNYTTIKRKTLIYPVINHPHSDKETGQNYVHYHTDFRFVKKEIDGSILNKDKRYTFAPNIRFNLTSANLFEFENYGWKENIKIEYHPLKCQRLNNFGIAGQVKIKTLKHKCIHKGKCPHRGYDLSQEVPDENGHITCPLHGLKFDQNKKLIS